MFKKNTKEDKKKIKQQWNYSDVYIEHERRPWMQENVAPFLVLIPKMYFIILDIKDGITAAYTQSNLIEYCNMFIWRFGTLFLYTAPFMKSNCISLYYLFWQWLCIPIHWNMSLTRKKLCSRSCESPKYHKVAFATGSLK